MRELSALFEQGYRTAWFESFGLKRLYFRKNSNQWRIEGEFFAEAEEMKLASRKAWAAHQKEIKRFVNSWKNAWEREDLDAYISCYDSTFLSRGMDLEAWREHRKRLNRKYDSLRIRVKGLKIERVSRRMVAASFKQDYRGDRYRDYGLKKVLLVKKGMEWKIKREEWKPLNKK